MKSETEEQLVPYETLVDDLTRCHEERLAILSKNEGLRAVLKMFIMGDGCAIGCYRMKDGSHSPACAGARAVLG